MTIAIERSWCDLSADILNEIAERLLYVEQIRFRSVCKNWKSNTNPTKHAASKLPWVMSLQGENSFYLHDPSQKKSYFCHNEILSGTTVHASKHGWLLLSKVTYPLVTHSSFFFYTPFTHETIRLPLLNTMDGDQNMATFSTPPTSPDCVVFVLTLQSKCSKKIWTSTCSPRDTTWRTTLFDGADYGDIRSLAFARGAFYCRFSEKVMGSFEVAKQEWEIHPLPLLGETTTFYSLIESQDGNLLVLCRRRDRRPKSTKIFGYDQSKMEWLEVERIDNAMLIYGCTRSCTSMLLPAVEEASDLANSIHLIKPKPKPRLHPGDRRQWDYVLSSYYLHKYRKGWALHTYDWIDQKLERKLWIQHLKQT